jgi:probable rRNA maturation factor
MPSREVQIANRHPRLRLNRRAVAKVIHTLDAQFFAPPVGSAQSKFENRKSKLESSPAGELSLVFLTDPALAQLHADFLADPTVTDVITFEGDPTAGTAGEICVSVDAALRQVGPRRDFSAELTLYLVHGWLHLAGYDDLVPAKKRMMRRAEARAMRVLEVTNTVPRFSLLR